MKIGNQNIGKGFPPYIIAEMSGNHNQSLEQAINIANAAKAAGASALKLQTYTADTLTIDCRKDDFLIGEADSLWSGDYLYHLYQSAYTDWDWIKAITRHCSDIGLDCFSSVFDETAVDFMEDLNPSAYKIASFENIHYPLIRKAASTGRPLILSTGLASTEELDEAVDCARSAGCNDLVLLKCTSDYPAKAEDANLLAMDYLHQRYGCTVGLSDHTMGNQVAMAAVALGAAVIEKHFTISREDGGVDSAFSADQTELTQLVKDCRLVAQSLGSPTLGTSDNEKKSQRFRRSIYAVDTIEPGAAFTGDNVRIIRPGYGLHPRHYDQLLQKTAKKRYEKGDRIGEDEL